MDVQEDHSRPDEALVDDERSPLALAALDGAPPRVSQRREVAIQLRAHGHSLRFIGERLGTPWGTVRHWLDTPEARHAVAQVAREDLPDLDDDARLARIHLRDRMLDASVDGRDRDRCAAILLANHSRVIEVLARDREADATTAQVKTADELRQLEKEATAYLDEARRQRS
jgi:hypothetical protein